MPLQWATSSVPDSNGTSPRIAEHALQRQAGGIVVGMPLSLNGKVGPQARRVEGFVKALRGRMELPVYTVDERFSTAEAERLLRQAGRQPSRHKGEADAAAAAVILQDYLDQLRGQPGSCRELHGGHPVL